jgi:hypothetical protein
VDAVCDRPYRLHFFEMAIRGQSSAGAAIPLYGELVAVREELGDSVGHDGRFAVVPADCLIDLPGHPAPPTEVGKLDVNPATDFLKSTYQTERRLRCQEDRKRFVSVCRDYLDRSFKARIRAAQDREMELRQRELIAPEVSLARQRAEADLLDLQRTQRERMQGLERLAVAKHGPIRHIASALVLPPGSDVPRQFADLLEDIDPEIRRKSEKAAEDVVDAYETGRGWECQRVGHLKIGFDIRSQAPPDPQTGYRDPMRGIRRIEVKGRRRGQPIRLTTNEWYKGAQLGDSYWLYVVWDPLGKPNPVPVMIQNPVKHLDHAKKEVIAARYFDIPAEAVESAAKAENV